MITGLDAYFWVCLCWVNALFRSFYFLSGFSESVMAVRCLVYLSEPLVSSQGMLLVLEAGIQGWVEGGRLRENGLWVPQEMWTKAKGGLHLIIHCSRRGETAGFRLLEYRKGEEKVFGEPSWFSGGHQDLVSVSQYLTSMCTISAPFPGSQRLNDVHARCYGRVWGDHASTMAVIPYLWHQLLPPCWPEFCLWLSTGSVQLGQSQWS